MTKPEEYCWVDGPLNEPSRQLRLFENEDPRGSRLRITKMSKTLFVSVSGKTTTVNYCLDAFGAEVLRDMLNHWLVEQTYSIPPEGAIIGVDPGSRPSRTVVQAHCGSCRCLESEVKS